MLEDITIKTVMIQQKLINKNIWRKEDLKFLKYGTF